MVGWGKGVMYLLASGHSVEIGLQWTRPAVLAAGGEGGLSLFLLFLYFILFYLPLSFTLLLLLSLFSLSLGNGMKWPIRVDILFNNNTTSISNPSTWTEESFLPLYLLFISSNCLWNNSVFYGTSRLTILTCHIMRSLICKYIYPNWLWVFTLFSQGHVWDVLMNKKHHSATINISVLPKHIHEHIVFRRFTKQFRSRYGAVIFVLLDSHILRIENFKESRQFRFFIPNTINVQTYEFQATR